MVINRLVVISFFIWIIGLNISLEGMIELTDTQEEGRRLQKRTVFDSPMPGPVIVNMIKDWSTLPSSKVADSADFWNKYVYFMARCDKKDKHNPIAVCGDDNSCEARWHCNKCLKRTAKKYVFYYQKEEHIKKLIDIMKQYARVRLTDLITQKGEKTEKKIIEKQSKKAWERLGGSWWVIERKECDEIVENEKDDVITDNGEDILISLLSPSVLLVMMNEQMQRYISSSSAAADKKVPSFSRYQEIKCTGKEEEVINTALLAEQNTPPYISFLVQFQEKINNDIEEKIKKLASLKNLISGYKAALSLITPEDGGYEKVKVWISKWQDEIEIWRGLHLSLYNAGERSSLLNLLQKKDGLNCSNIESFYNRLEILIENLEDERNQNASLIDTINSMRADRVHLHTTENYKRDFIEAKVLPLLISYYESNIWVPLLKQNNLSLYCKNKESVYKDFFRFMNIIPSQDNKEEQLTNTEACIMKNVYKQLEYALYGMRCIEEWYQSHCITCSAYNPGKEEYERKQKYNKLWGKIVALQKQGSTLEVTTKIQSLKRQIGKVLNNSYNTREESIEKQLWKIEGTITYLELLQECVKYVKELSTQQTLKKEIQNKQEGLRIRLKELENKKSLENSLKKTLKNLEERITALTSNQLSAVPTSNIFSTVNEQKYTHQKKEKNNKQLIKKSFYIIENYIAGWEFLKTAGVSISNIKQDIERVNETINLIVKKFNSSKINTTGSLLQERIKALTGQRIRNFHEPIESSLSEIENELIELNKEKEDAKLNSYIKQENANKDFVEIALTRCSYDMNKIKYIATTSDSLLDEDTTKALLDREIDEQIHDDKDQALENAKKNKSKILMNKEKEELDRLARLRVKEESPVTLLRERLDAVTSDTIVNSAPVMQAMLRRIPLSINESKEQLLNYFVDQKKIIESLMKEAPYLHFEWKQAKLLPDQLKVLQKIDAIIDIANLTLEEEKRSFQEYVIGNENVKLKEWAERLKEEIIQIITEQVALSETVTANLCDKPLMKSLQQDHTKRLNTIIETIKATTFVNIKTVMQAVANLSVSFDRDSTNPEYNKFLNSVINSENAIQREIERSYERYVKLQ